MLPATECSTRMMALTRAGWEPINLANRSKCEYESLSSWRLKQRMTLRHSHVQHVGVCELHKQIFVLENSCKGTNTFFEEIVMQSHLTFCSMQRLCELAVLFTTHLKRLDLTWALEWPQWSDPGTLCLLASYTPKWEGQNVSVDMEPASCQKGLLAILQYNLGGWYLLFRNNN